MVVVMPDGSVPRYRMGADSPTPLLRGSPLAQRSARLELKDLPTLQAEGREVLLADPNGDLPLRSTNPAFVQDDLVGEAIAIGWARERK